MSLDEEEKATRSAYSRETFLQDYKRVPGLDQLRFSRKMRLALRGRATAGSIFHTHGLWLMPNVYPAQIGNSMGIPVMLSPRGMLGPAALEFSKWKKKAMWLAFQGSALRAVDCFHATCEQEYQEIREYGLRQPVAIVPNGIAVYPSLVERGAEPQARTAVYVGRIHPKKGLDRLLAAWGMVEAKSPDWRLRIIGRGNSEYVGSLRRQATTLGLSRICFEDALFGETKDAAFRTSDVFVFPTLNENFGLTVAESLAQGTPVICTKGAPWAGLEGNRCGWWVDHGPESLAGALLAAMSIPRKELHAMGERGRDWMIRDFSWTGVAEMMSEVYEWLGRGGPVSRHVRIA
jgi:glycosyltransferase involved in cell wall biosynthesis